MGNVAVILPTWDRPQMLRESLDSLLIQEGVDLKLYLLNNGSQDGPTDEVIAEYLPKFNNPMYVKAKENSLDNIGKMQLLPTEKYIIDWTDDDIMLPGNIITKVKLLEQYDRAAFAFSPAIPVDITGNTLPGVWKGCHDRQSLSFYDMFCTCKVVMGTVVWRGRDYRAVEMQGVVSIGGEWERYLKTLSYGKFGIQHEDALTLLRIHNGTDSAVNGFKGGGFFNMHVAMWKHWITQGYIPSDEQKKAMIKILLGGVDPKWENPKQHVDNALHSIRRCINGQRV